MKNYAKSLNKWVTKSFCVATIVVAGLQNAFAGAEGHGGDHVRDRVLMAKLAANRFLVSADCAKSFSQKDCNILSQKLESAALDWYTDKNIPLMANVNGRDEEVTARTLPKMTAPITINLVRAENASLPELTVLLIHEVGHSLNLSHSLTSDSKAISAMADNLFAVGPTKFPIVNFENDKAYFQRWCEQVVRILRLARSNALYAETSAQEKAILLDAIENVLAISTERRHKFLIATLESAKSDYVIYTDLAHQADFLNKYVGFAIEDFEMFDRSFDDKFDNGPYVSTILERGLSLELQNIDETEGLLVLITTAQRAIYYLDWSDYRRTSRYSCARKVLSDALETIQNPAFDFDSRGKIEYLRRVMRNAAGNLVCD
ncbi:MAG: hypothetical protein ABL927_08725 [Bdellovibrionales bacterium]